MDRVLWEAGGVEAIGLQVVTIQYWRPELGCREGREAGLQAALGNASFPPEASIPVQRRSTALDAYRTLTIGPTGNADADGGWRR